MGDPLNKVTEKLDHMQLHSTHSQIQIHSAKVCSGLLCWPGCAAVYINADQCLS